MLTKNYFEIIIFKKLRIASFMGARKNAFFSAGKTHVRKIPRFGGGGGIWGFGEGGSADFIFTGAGIFLIKIGLD